MIPRPPRPRRRSSRNSGKRARPSSARSSSTIRTTKEAEVLVEIGLIQAEDRIHVKGQTTDFYQDLRGLKAYGAKAKRVTSGYTAVVRTSKPCEAGDFVYIVCKRGVPPFFLAPLGIAAIVAGAVPLSATFEEEPVSPFKIK